MLFSHLVDTSRNVAATSRRLAKIELLAALLAQLRGEEIDIVSAFLAGRTRQGKTGIGYRTLQAAQATPAEHPTLEILGIDRRLEELAAIKGKGSEQTRLSQLRDLMAAATAEEQHFLRGLLVGELRQGALEGLLVDAIAKASRLNPDRVRRAVMMAGDLVPVARAALEQGESGLDIYRLQLFRPVQPMLAQPAESMEEAIAALGEAALEYKMDGARIQVHRSGNDVAVYTRQLNDVTAAVPEVVETVLAMPARELILDGEVLSFQPDGRPQPFQVTMRRFGRKLEVDAVRQTLPLTPYFFDLLFQDGGELLGDTQARRFDALRTLSPQTVIPHIITADSQQAEEFLSQALAIGHEGIMAKSRTAIYDAGARGAGWLKVKQAQTLDLVILAAEWGSGRRQGWLSNLHLGARDPEKGGYAMLGKTFKGLTDEMLTWQTAELLKSELARDAHTVYVEPKIVAEIAFHELQISPRYASGLALRFARVKRYRLDKTPDQADTFATVRRLAGENQ
ncbi:MAG: ATP-dependent DNA ligase [Acidobacteria bacterium]|nr:ATP-dependent DNA ligase [Acidobacteriota bacterium]